LIGQLALIVLLICAQDSFSLGLGVIQLAVIRWLGAGGI
jgi:hypothetical protein